MKEFLKIIRRYVAPYKGYLCGSVVLNILSAVFNIFSFSLLAPILKILFDTGSKVYEFVPWHAGMKASELINNIYYYVSVSIDKFGASTVLLGLCVIFSIITLVKTSCYFGASAVMVPIRTGVVKDMRMQIYNKIVALPIGFFSQERKGDIIARMSGDVQEVEYSITSTLDMLIKNPVLIIFYMSWLFYQSWQLTLFTILFAPLVIWGMGMIGRRLKADSAEAQQYWSDTMSQVEETLGGLRIIKAFIAEDKMKKRFDSITPSMRRKTRQVSVRQASAHPVSEFIGTVMIAMVLWFGGTLILGEKAVIDAPAFMSYMAILYSVIQPIKDLSKAAYGIPKGLASMERIDFILNTENHIKEPEKPVHIDSINGSHIRDISLHDLRELIGNVNQDPILFNDTIFNNIAFGVESATREQVEAAARIANAHQFIMEKEEGYDTNVGDRGIKLSGGQRQRISIARAILKNPPILILDEATASLDTESERLVQDALDHLMSTRTTIAIAHRLSTVKGADEIIVMNEGKIVERGTHDELIAKDGHYRKLYDMQAL